MLLTRSLLGIVKKILDTFKAESLRYDILPSFLSAFKSLLNLGASGEVFRTVSLFVTYALYRGRSSAAKPATIARDGEPAEGTTVLPSNTSALNGSSRSDSSASGEILSYSALAVVILRIYTDLLCSDKEQGNIRKFARAVTNKVFQCSFSVLLFIGKC